MKVDHIWKIRDARGLDSWEKTFLFTAASHNSGMYCTWNKNCEDMGMKKDRYYKCIESLKEKNLIQQTRRFDDTTVFVVNEDGLDDWLVAHSVSQNGDSVTQNGHSATQKNHSVRPETKVNTKGNKKVNKKENSNSVADAPSFSLDKNNKTNKEDAVDPATPIGGNPAAGLIEGTDTRHSVTQNDPFAQTMTEEERIAEFIAWKASQPKPEPKVEEDWFA